MKKITLSIIIFSCFLASVAQKDEGVIISDDASKELSSSAILELYSQNKALVLPVRDETTSLIDPPADGLTMFINNSGINYYHNNEWHTLADESSSGNGDMPIGTILMYYGPVSSFTSKNDFTEEQRDSEDFNPNLAYGIGKEDDLVGWYLCDGRNGRPNLSEMFVIGGNNDVGVVPEGHIPPLIEDQMNSVIGDNSKKFEAKHLPLDHKHDIKPISLSISHDHTVTTDLSHNHDIVVTYEDENSVTTNPIKTLQRVRTNAGNGYVSYPVRSGEPEYLLKDNDNYSEKWPNKKETGKTKAGFTVTISDDAVENTNDKDKLLSSQGNDLIIDNRPLYYVLAYIIYLGADGNFTPESLGIIY